MSVKIVNRSKQLLVIPLNSGATLHLAPGEEAIGIEPIEVKKNPTIEKLAQKNWLLVAEGEEDEKPARESKRGKSK